jgi:hypothetical protein
LAGGVPANVTVPVTDEAAKLTLGESATAAINAAIHNRDSILRMLGSLVIANLVSVVTFDAAAAAA